MVIKQAENGLHLMSIALNIVIDFLSPTGPDMVTGERDRHRWDDSRDRELLPLGDTIRRILKTLSSELLRRRVTWREQTVEIVQYGTLRSFICDCGSMGGCPLSSAVPKTAEISPRKLLPTRTLRPTQY
jgi:hypothetical protein